jgi:6-phosphofructokinase 1
MKKIALMTSGGDAPGMNACIRSVVRTSIAKSIKVYGINRGYEGLINDDIYELTSAQVSNIIQRGGTILKSARSKSFMTVEGQVDAVNILNKRNIDGLIVIGGDGSLTGANILYKKYGIKVVGIPCSIDNDIYGTDNAIGVDTALNRIISAIDIINDTASSHDRTFIIEVMGRNCGYLALMSSIAGGAEYALIPEKDTNIEEIIDMVKLRYREGKSRSILIVAEGAGSAASIAKIFTEKGYIDTRITILGHLQRGGSPTYFDRMLSTAMGIKAVEGLIDGEYGKMVALRGSMLYYIPLEEAIGKKKELEMGLLDINKMLNV